MREEVSLTFQFKGERTYVHGTDIFNTIIEHIGKNCDEIKNIALTFQNIIRSQVDCFVIEAPDLINYSGDCVFKFETKDKGYATILKSNGEKISQRYLYPENEITRLCRIENKTISLEENINFTNIEKIVAMNKALLEHLFNQNNGKWFFSKLTLNSNFELDTYEKYSLTLIKNMGLKLTKTAINLNGKQVGYIYFSLV